MQEKIKICSIIPGLRSGGIEKLLEDYYSTGNWKDFDISIITHGFYYESMKKKLDLLGIKLYVVPEKRKNLFQNFTELYKIIKDNNFDIVHSHMGHLSFFALFPAIVNRVPIRIMHVHEKPRKSLITKIELCLSLIFSNKFCACSKDSAIHLFGNAFGKKCTIICNAIEIDKYRFSQERRKDIRSTLQLKDSDICFGHIGRFVYEKNHEFLISLFSKVNNDKIKLLLIGDGPLKEEINTYIKMNNLLDRVIILPYCNDVYKYYSAMDLFLLPSLNEGFGLVALEAQINGLQCVISDAVPREVAVTDNCKFIRLDQALWLEELRLITNVNCRYIDIGNENIKKYNIHHATEQLKSYYKELYYEWKNKKSYF